MVAKEVGRYVAGERRSRQGSLGGSEGTCLRSEGNASNASCRARGVVVGYTHTCTSPFVVVVVYIEWLVIPFSWPSAMVIASSHIHSPALAGFGIFGCPGIASPVDSCTTPAHVLAAWWRRTPRQDCHTRPPLQPHTHGPFLSSPWTLTWASRLSSRAKARLHTGHANGRSWV